MLSLPQTMVTTTCNASDVIKYSDMCLDKDPPDDCYPNYSSLAAAMWQAFLVLNIIVGLTGNLLTLLSIPYAKYHQGRDSPIVEHIILNLESLFCYLCINSAFCSYS
jgi:hypothetical protein